jgi:hypothetical protein
MKPSRLGEKKRSVQDFAQTVQKHCIIFFCCHRLTCDKMNSLTLGCAGTVVACLIFLTLFVTPWTELTRSFSPQAPQNTSIIQIPENATISVSLSISNFTEPQGPGSEANVTINVVSRKNMPNAQMRITLSPVYVGQGAWPNMTWTPIGPQGITLTDGISTWTLNLIENVSTHIIIRVKATEVGVGVITATALWWETPTTLYQDEETLCIKVLEESIQVYYDTQTINFP